ncbi:exosome complex component RRP43 [Jimgerdemannia flammicorona]|uniref:Ribosomal RNA-processing protein 43 n=1 Tax=Jimgerdemannia flammicorona TaxID=994334 RepID=A0A433D3J7_9FUNG|nr:exosome complex component RRP43 [Jimgerdemannia flammicorona]
MATDNADVFRRIQPHEYFRRFIEQNVRPDGRQLHKFRKTTLNVGAISTANGSAMVRIGGTTVICGIKAEVAEPKISTPDEGFLDPAHVQAHSSYATQHAYISVPNVELSPICSPKFRSGPPSEQAQVASEFLNKIIKISKVLSLTDLCIEPSKAVWVLYADVLCLSYDGNVLDASLLALVSALLDPGIMSLPYPMANRAPSVSNSFPPLVQLPKVTYSEGIVRALADEPVTRLTLYRIPVSTTLSLLAKRLLSDPSDAEESLADEQVTVTIDERGRLCHIWKVGGGSNTATPDVLKECIQRARARYGDVKGMVERAFKERRVVFVASVGDETEMDT